jgi:molybdopterin synthase sulfur carrier subunit
MMGVTVRIPTPLRKLTEGKDEVASDGKSIGEVINDLENQFPGLKERICDEDGNLRRFVNIYLNDEDIRFSNNLQTEVSEGDELSIIPAIAGGSMEKRKIYLTYPQGLIKEPLIFQVGKKYKVVTNIRQASISEEIGLVALELEGERDEIKSAIQYFKDNGVKVEPIEKDVIE